MALFKDIEGFCEHYPALESVAWERLLPAVEKAEMRYLRNVVLGPVLYNELHASYLASIRENSPEPMSPELQTLRERCLKALANLSVYEGIPALSAFFTSGGLRQKTVEGESAAPMWLSNQTRDDALTTGHLWLDDLVDFLLTHKSDYPNWGNSPMHQELSGSLVTTLTTADTHTRVLGCAWLLHQLRPTMRSLQNGILRTTMGGTRLDALQLKLNTNAALDATEKALLDQARPALIYGALAEDIIPLRIRVDRTGAYMLEGSSGSNNMTRVEKSLSTDQVNALVRSCSDKSKAFLSNIAELVRPNQAPLLPGGTGGVFVM